MRLSAHLRVFRRGDPQTEAVLHALLGACVRERRRRREGRPVRTEKETLGPGTYEGLEEFMGSARSEVLMVATEVGCVGVVLLESWANDPDGVWLVREFYLEPLVRRRGLGTAVVRLLASTRPGEWHASLDERDLVGRGFIEKLERRADLSRVRYRSSAVRPGRLLVEGQLGPRDRAMLCTGSRLKSPKLQCPQLSEIESRPRWADARSD